MEQEKKNAPVELSEDALDTVTGGTQNGGIVFVEAPACDLVYHCRECGVELRFASADAKVLTECPGCGNTETWLGMHEMP